MNLEVMNEGDIPQVGERVINAFYDKFKEDTALPKETLRKLIQVLWLKETEAFNMKVFVLKEGDEVVGTFGLSYPGKPKPTLSLIAKALAAVKYVGWREFINFVRSGLSTSRMPDSDELYIDFIAVKETYRNQNLGHRLMEEIDRIKWQTPGVRKTSLYVLKDNEPAKHLYQKYGYNIAPSKAAKNYFFMVNNS